MEHWDRKPNLYTVIHYINQREIHRILYIFTHSVPEEEISLVWNHPTCPNTYCLVGNHSRRNSISILFRVTPGFYLLHFYFYSWSQSRLKWVTGNLTKKFLFYDNSSLLGCPTFLSYSFLPLYIMFVLQKPLINCQTKLGFYLYPSTITRSKNSPNILADFLNIK